MQYLHIVPGGTKRLVVGVVQVGEPGEENLRRGKGRIAKGIAERVAEPAVERARRKKKLF